MDSLKFQEFLQVMVRHNRKIEEIAPAIQQELYASKIHSIYARIQLERVIVTFDVTKRQEVIDIQLFARRVYREPGNLDEKEIRRLIGKYELDFQQVSNHPVELREPDAPMKRHGYTFMQHESNKHENFKPYALSKYISNLSDAQAEFDTWLERADYILNRPSLKERIGKYVPIHYFF